MSIEFEWDENKNLMNQLKHKVSFELASKVFNDCFHITSDIQYIDNEERWLTIGRVHDIHLIIVYTYCQDNLGNEYIRIISARRATKLERSRYVENYRRTIG
jgi:uncharacterized DUF497 family protein